MSEENKGASAPAAAANSGTADLVKNLKSEMDRKISNLEAMNRKLLDQVAIMAKPKTEASKSASLDDVWLDNPRQAADLIKQELRQEAVVAQKTNTTIAKLVQEFPELNDESSDLTKRAVEIFEGFSSEEKSSPVAYRAAVREAAQELGVSPASKRKSDDGDEFSLSGSGSSRTRTEARGRRDTLDPNTAEFARLMGLDVDKPEVKERLKSHQKRTWKNYGK